MYSWLVNSTTLVKGPVPTGLGLVQVEGSVMLGPDVLGHDHGIGREQLRQNRRVHRIKGELDLIGADLLDLRDLAALHQAGFIGGGILFAVLKGEDDISGRERLPV